MVRVEVVGVAMVVRECVWCGVQVQEAGEGVGVGVSVAGKLPDVGITQGPRASNPVSVPVATKALVISCVQQLRVKEESKFSQHKIPCSALHTCTSLLVGADSSA